MTAPRPRKPRDIETFRDRRAKKRRPGTTIGALTVKLTFDASAFAPTEVIEGIREIVRDEIDSNHLMHSGYQGGSRADRMAALKADRERWLSGSSSQEAPLA